MAALLAFATPSVGQQHGHGDEEPAFYATCHDGQKTTTAGMACDTDERADGTCTFGERDGKNLRVPVGQTRKMVNSCHAVGQFTCERPLAARPVIIEPGKPVPVVRPEVPAGKARRPADGSCTKDSDCVPTTSNGCVARGVFKDLQDPNNTDVRCRCMKGVFNGCVPRGSDWEAFGKKLNR